MTSAEGGAMGLPKKEDKIREVAYCRSVLNVDKEGGRSKSPNFLWMSFMDVPIDRMPLKLGRPSCANCLKLPRKREMEWEAFVLP